MPSINSVLKALNGISPPKRRRAEYGFQFLIEMANQGQFPWLHSEPEEGAGVAIAHQCQEVYCQIASESNATTIAAANPIPTKPPIMM